MSGVGRVGRPSRAYRATQARGLGGTSEVTVVGAIAPIPQDLPQHVRDSFTALHAEVEDLRRRLALARTRIEELERLVESDELTPIANRRGFERDLRRTLSDVDRHGMSAALVFIDVDGLKVINDMLGHVGGDAVLVHVGNTLKAMLRESDSAARIGGDEFAIILRQVDSDQARAKTLDIMQNVAATPVRSGGFEVPVSVSAGFCMLAPDDDPESVLSRANREMHAHRRTVRR